jgi:hypothetical protein
MSMFNFLDDTLPVVSSILPELLRMLQSSQSLTTQLRDGGDDGLSLDMYSLLPIESSLESKKERYFHRLRTAWLALIRLAQTCLEVLTYHRDKLPLLVPEVQASLSAGASAIRNILPLQQGGLDPGVALTCTTGWKSKCGLHIILGN